MPRYNYVALDTAGKKRSGGIDAASEFAAREGLQKRNLLPVQIASAGAAAVETAQPAKGGRVRATLTHKERLLVTRQLSTLVEAAVPVDEALGMIAAQQETPTAKRVMADVQVAVVEGARLADALGRHPKSFPGLYRSAVAGGERSGQLGAVLVRMGDYLARAEALRSKVTTAMVYPAALSLVAITVVTCLMIFVVPSLAEQFKSFQARLPLLTQILIGTSTFLATYWAILLAALLGGGYFLRVLLKREPVRFAIDAFMLRAPIIGRWTRAVNASRFARAVSTLTASGLTVLDSVRQGREAVDNRVVAKAIGEMGARIEEGEPLSAAMRRSGLIPPMVAYMAASGENAGDLSGMLEKAADYLDQEFEAFTNSALSLLEPAIIVFMGAIVAMIVLAIMLPVLQLNRLATG